MNKQHHYLKIKPEYFKAVKEGIKPFEIRYNDRNYHVNDILHLKEWVDGEYSGKEITAVVTYILDDPTFCKKDYVVLGIRKEKKIT